MCITILHIRRTSCFLIYADTVSLLATAIQSIARNPLYVFWNPHQSSATSIRSKSIYRSSMRMKSLELKFIYHNICIFVYIFFSMYAYIYVCVSMSIYISMYVSTCISIAVYTIFLVILICSLFIPLSCFHCFYILEPRSISWLFSYRYAPSSSSGVKLQPVGRPFAKSMGSQEGRVHEFQPKSFFLCFAGIAFGQ